MSILTIFSLFVYMKFKYSARIDQKQTSKNCRCSAPLGQRSTAKPAYSVSSRFTASITCGINS